MKLTAAGDKSCDHFVMCVKLPHFCWKTCGDSWGWGCSWRGGGAGGVSGWGAVGARLVPPNRSSNPSRSIAGGAAGAATAHDSISICNVLGSIVGRNMEPVASWQYLV